jgi:cytochrome c oxidase subunit 2
MGKALSLTIVAATLATVILFWRRVWWFPPNISALGEGVDREFRLTLVVTGILFVAAQLILAYCIGRRRRAARASYRTGSARMEVAWMILTAVIFISLALSSYRVWADMYFIGAPANAVKIQVEAEQFAYWFRYPGPDGVFGPMHLRLINDATGNYFGLDPARDPASRDNIVTATLGIPVNRPIDLLLMSRDVIHSFYVPQLRIQQDIVPGMVIPIHFTATRTGNYEIVCTQLCGLGHYAMHAPLKVMTEVDFKKWLARQAAEQ